MLDLVKKTHTFLGRQGGRSFLHSGRINGVQVRLGTGHRHQQYG